MKVVSKIINTCALLLAGTVYAAQTPTVAHEKPVVTQNISIINATGKIIYGGVYLTNLSGTNIINGMEDPHMFDSLNPCWTFNIKKPADKKSTEFHRIIVTTNFKDRGRIKFGLADKSQVGSTRIRLFSGSKPLTYKVTLNSKGKLNISRETKATCNTLQKTELPY